MATPTIADPADDLITDVIGQIEAVMEARGISRSELATMMGVTPGYVSHLFVHKDRNLTIRSLVKLVEILDCTVTIAVKPVKRTKGR
jgi:DNA-binding Xre family transcriptional regulator